MSDLNIALILKLVDKATGPARAAARALQNMGGEALLANARRVRAGTEVMGTGLVSIRSGALKAAAALGLVSGTAVAMAKLFVRPAAEFERYNVQLTNLEGSADGAKRAMGWIEDFATRTPLELANSVDAYAKLKAFGIDPTNGSLQALVDTMAATGGGAEKLDGLVLALGQAWTKGKLQGEEALQLLERGVPVYDILAEKMGMTTEQIIEMQTKGKLGREEITLLIEALGERNKGASEAMAQTWDGIISNLMDWWTRFQRMVMDSGLFQWMKDRLQQTLDLLNAMAADGRLQAWAERTGQMIILTLEKLWEFGAGVVAVWNLLAPQVAYVAELLGGWDRLAWLGGALLMRGMIWDLVKGFALLAAGAVQLIGGLAGMAVAVWPVTAAVAAFAGLAYVIYDNWGGINGWFSRKFKSINDAAERSLMQGALATFAEFNPFTVAYQGAEGFYTYVTGMTFRETAARLEAELGFAPLTGTMDYLKSIFDYVASGAPNAGAHLKEMFDNSPAMNLWRTIREFYDWLMALDWSEISRKIIAAFENIDLMAAGAAMIDSLWQGIATRIDAMISWVKGKLSEITPSWMGGGSPAVASNSGASGSWGPAAVTPGGATGGRALGGPVRAGQIYEWQEQGRELFVPQVDGRVIDNRALRRMEAGAERADAITRQFGWLRSLPTVVSAGETPRGNVVDNRAARPGVAGAGRTAPAAIHLGGITVNAAPGMDPQAVARAVRRELEAALRTARHALHDGGEHA